MKNEILVTGNNPLVSETNPYLIDYMRKLIVKKIKDGKDRTAGNYLSALNKFCAFQQDKAETLTILELTPELLSDYLQWLTQTEELTEGTIDFYLRTFKAMYNKGVKEFHLHPDFGNPFEGTAVKVPPTRKRALPDEVFDRLMSLDLSDKPHLLSALHLALFIFYARGMSFIDVFNLTDENLVDNYIVYKRSKTQASLQVKITPEMKRLLKIYRKRYSPWLFPFLHEKMHGRGEASPQSSLHRVNRYLKEIGDMLELSHPLTTYVMRHSWASFMLEAGSELGVISQSLGHTSMHTTEIYLSNLSVGKIDKAADDMLNTIIRKKKFYRKELLEELDLPHNEKSKPVGKEKHIPTQPAEDSKAVPAKKENSPSKVWTALASLASKMRKFRELK